MNTFESKNQDRLNIALAKIAEQHSASPGASTYECNSIKFSDFPHLSGKISIGRFRRKVVCFAAHTTVKIRLASGALEVSRVTAAWRDPESAEARGFFLPLYFNHILPIHGATVSARKYSSSAFDRGRKITAKCLELGFHVYRLESEPQTKLEPIEDLEAWENSSASGVPTVFSIRKIGGL